MLVIQPTYTLTPTPTPTKTPLPPTNTPRPTFTPAPGGNAGTAVRTPVIDRLPAPDFAGLLDRAAGLKTTVGWILVGICIPGIFISLFRRK